VLDSIGQKEISASPCPLFTPCGLDLNKKKQALPAKPPSNPDKLAYNSQ
jgi:hypothetical protein